ncbi:MAG: hypothetical protein IKY82_06105 [Alistipes sp.]|nr:hypothetical protein [Alistipes sp.]
MIYAFYLLTVAAVVWFSILASRYIDMIDRSTKLSGAFLGGVLLSAITSLPELFTSISATVLIDDASLCIGNILGSNLFNFGMLAVVILFFLKGFTSANLSRSHRTVMLLLILMYVGVWLNWQQVVDSTVVLGGESPWFYMSVTSLVIVVLYILSVRYLAGDNGSDEEADDDGEEVTLSMRSIVVRFVAASIGIIVASIILTYITDDIAERLNLGSGLAGALFLGVATSLPEVTSTISLFRMRNFNIAFGNIAGSNVFNYFVLAIADLLYVRGTVYYFDDSKVVNLTMFGLLASALIFVLLCSRNKWVKALLAMATIGCYLAFLLV